jgi:sec-independent protein translocase protein TatA
MFDGIFQPMHLLLILVIALIIFGPGRLGDIGAELGKSIKNFKKAMQDIDKPATAPDPQKLDEKAKQT